MVRKKTITINEWIELLKPEKYKLVDFRGDGSIIKQLIQCEKEHQYECCYENFRQGHRCKFCYGNDPHTEYELIQMLEKENHQLLEYRGIGSWRKHLLLCPKGHQFEMSYNTLQKGYRCKFCSGKATHTEEDFIKILEEEKNQLLEYRAIGNKRKHLVLCPNGHKFETSYDNFRLGSRCPE